MPLFRQPFLRLFILNSLMYFCYNNRSLEALGGCFFDEDLVTRSKQRKLSGFLSFVLCRFHKGKLENSQLVMSLAFTVSAGQGEPCPPVLCYLFLFYLCYVICFMLSVLCYLLIYIVGWVSCCCLLSFLQE